LEGGAPRFFRRLAEGVFDQVDLARRTDELADFIEAAVVTYGSIAPVSLRSILERCEHRRQPVAAAARARPVWPYC